MMTTCGWERQRVWKKKAAERHHLYQTVQYCKLLLKVRPYGFDNVQLLRTLDQMSRSTLLV